ncbi:MAG: hypothetical protein NWE79_05085 [Candidatus Bathyarchaeota archaeon]|nr:hypothetical protein [Candidatus Bathyarchaeota archaeon]
MDEVPSGVSGDVEDRSRRLEGLKGMGLHFCSRYSNLVRFDPVFCGRCPFNGMKAASRAPRSSGTRF